MKVYRNGRVLNINLQKSIGKGGEADVYDVGRGLALKLFKPPDHIDYTGFPEEQTGAKKRLKEHQTKLLRFPKNLPPRVIVPVDLVTDKSKRIVGYVMKLLRNTDPLLSFADPGFRKQGISNEKVVKIFLDIHQTVKELHKKNVIIGDFNDLNILVDKLEAYLIDADSFQFERFLCQMFTGKFVDPILCKLGKNGMELARPYGFESDWYSYVVMLFQCLLYVDPYGGVYRPKKGKKIKQNQRPMHRVTVFDPGVRYPKPATPFTVLGDDLLHYFTQVFMKDIREEFPVKLLKDFKWTTCPDCGVEHARQQCPNCKTVSPLAVKEKIEVIGKVSAQRIFITKGSIIHAAIYSNKLNWLYHENNEFKREDGSMILKGGLEPNVRYRLQEKNTFMAKNGKLVILSKLGQKIELVDCFGRLPMFDVNQKKYFWLNNGQLCTDSQFGAEFIGDTLPNQTLFWAGEKMGFGFYRAGEISVSFVFDPERKGINDSVKIPRIRGQLIDSTCFFANNLCWFLFSYRDKGKTINGCYLIGANGKVLAEAQVEAGGGSWLDKIRGKCAANNFLLAATDEGIVRIEQESNRLKEVKIFVDTERFVDSSNHLFLGKDGLYAVSQRKIILLRIS